MKEILAQNLVQADVNQAAHLVRSMLTEKYISPIKAAVQNENKRIKKNPCKNARLLEALKPFVDANVRQSLASTIDMLYTIQTIQGVTGVSAGAGMGMGASGALPLKSSGVSVQNSIHPDGIYDIDPVCAGIAPSSSSSANAVSTPMPMMPMMSMMLMFLLLGGL